MQHKRQTRLYKTKQRENNNWRDKRRWEDQWVTELWLRDQLQWETNKQQAELCAAHVMEYLYPEDYKWVLKRLKEKHAEFNVKHPNA